MFSEKVPCIFSYLSHLIFLWMSFLVLGLMCLIQPFCFCPCLIDETPTPFSLLLPPHLRPPLCTFYPARPLYSFLFPSNFFMFLCLNSIMDVHKAQFTFRAFSITSLVNSLAASAFSAACLCGGRTELSVCVHPAYTLAPSARRPTVVTNYTHLPRCGTQCMCKTHG